MKTSACSGWKWGGINECVRVNITEDLEMMTCVMKAGLHSEKIRQEQFLGYGWQETLAFFVVII